MPRVTDETLDEVAAMIAAGETVRGVATRMGRPVGTVASWSRRPDLTQKVAAIKAKKAQAAAAAAKPQKSVSDHDFGVLAKTAALAAFGALQQRAKAGEAIPAAEWSRVSATMARLVESDSDPRLSADAMAGALAEADLAAAVIDALDSRTASVMLAGLRERSFEMLRRERSFDSPGVATAFRVCERWLTAAAAAEWYRRWSPILGLASEDAARLLARDAHAEVCAAHQDDTAGGFAVIDERHDVARITAVLDAAHIPDTNEKKDTDHAPA